MSFILLLAVYVAVKSRVKQLELSAVDCRAWCGWFVAPSS